MSKNLRTFLLCFLLSLFFWWGINVFQKNLEDFFYVRYLKKYPFPQSTFIAQISPQYSSPKIELLHLEAESAISVKVNEKGEEKILFKKNETEKMPIASLTKLITAFVVSELYPLEQKIPVSVKAVNQMEDKGNLKPGEVLTVRDLLHIMLIESSNDAAFALVEPIGTENFVELMNLMAKEDIGMRDSQFFNPTGVDPEDFAEASLPNEINLSTAQDLVRLAEYLLKQKPLILDILGKKQYRVQSENGDLHMLKNINKLLGEIPGVIGGKTGYTERAGGCLILIVKEDESYLINVILNSPHKFEEMEELISYVRNTSY